MEPRGIRDAFCSTLLTWGRFGLYEFSSGAITSHDVHPMSDHSSVHPTVSMDTDELNWLEKFDSELSSVDPATESSICASRVRAGALLTEMVIAGPYAGVAAVLNRLPRIALEITELHWTSCCRCSSWQAGGALLLLLRLLVRGHVELRTIFPRCDLSLRRSLASHLYCSNSRNRRLLHDQRLVAIVKYCWESLLARWDPGVSLDLFCLDTTFGASDESCAADMYKCMNVRLVAYWETLIILLPLPRDLACLVVENLAGERKTATT